MKSTLPSDVKVSARLIQKVEQIIAQHPSRTGTTIKFNANIFWVDSFGIMYTEWNVTGLSDAEGKYFYELVDETRQVELVSTAYEAGRKAVFMLDRLFAIIDPFLDETVKHMKKEHAWEELVRNAVKS
jgi:hypothetical protein